MEYYYSEEKNLFSNYNKKHYEEDILSNKANNCCNCKNYKVGNCILLEMMVTFSYVCPHFVKKDKGNRWIKIYFLRY